VVVIDLHAVLFTEPRIVTGEPRFWGDVGENGKHEFNWEFEDCE